MNDWIDPQGRRWTNIVPIGVRVVAGPPIQMVTLRPRPDLVLGRKARTLAEVDAIQRHGYAGKE